MNSGLGPSSNFLEVHMKAPLSPPSSVTVPTRREFLAKSASAVAGFTILPRHVLGGVGFIPPSDKVNIGFI